LVDGLEKSEAVVGPYVSHVHFSSNKGQRSDHCTPQEGVMDFKPVASFLQKVPGLLVIELNERGGQSASAVLQTRDFLLDLLQSGVGKAERGRE
jgi:sugar phosphate isomerase/epimerase